MYGFHLFIENFLFFLFFFNMANMWDGNSFAIVNA